MSFFDEPRLIYVISPQPWEGFKVSKHHYASTLAAQGHEVYFIESGTTTTGWGRIEIRQTEIPNLQTVRYAGVLFRFFRFKARIIYDALVDLKVRQIVDAIGVEPDIIWDFDNLFQFTTLDSFPAKIKIFHPVDSLITGHSPHKGQDLTLTLAEEFVRGLDPSETPTLLLPHGLNPIHAQHAENVVATPERFSTANTKPVVGYVGNLSADGIDWKTILGLVDEHPLVKFRFIGPSGALKDTDDRKKFAVLSESPNVQMVGPLELDDVVKEALEVDIWLVCYDVTQRPDAAINSHKVLEYLATGKTIISNYIHLYKDTGLLFMPDSSSNKDMSKILSRVLQTPQLNNTHEEMVRRAGFTRKYSYKSNLKKIERFLNEHICDPCKKC